MNLPPRPKPVETENKIEQVRNIITHSKTPQKNTSDFFFESLSSYLMSPQEDQKVLIRKLDSLKMNI